MCVVRDGASCCGRRDLLLVLRGLWGGWVTYVARVCCGGRLIVVWSAPAGCGAHVFGCMAASCL